MLIGELCRQAGVSKDAVRHYEEVGLVSCSTKQAGARRYRWYDEVALEQLRFIKAGQRAGFSLKELKVLVKGVKSGKIGRAEFKRILRDQIARVERKIAEHEDAIRFLRQEIMRADSIDFPKLRNC
jgi:DNA-binding transcriptional MerR regulator